MTPNSRGSHLSVIDALRGLAALAVCVFHFSANVDPVGPLLWPFNRFASCGYLGVPAFFVISGFVIPHSMKDWRLTPKSFSRFMSRRLLRLYPPYAIATVLSVALWYASALTPGFRGSWPVLEIHGLVASLTLTADLLGTPWVLIVAWSLAIEVQFYLAIALSQTALQHRLPSIRWLALGCWIAAPLVQVETALVSRWAALFASGIATWQFHAGLLSRWTWAIAILGAFAVHTCEFSVEGAVVGLVTAVLIAVVPRTPRRLGYVGTISYSLYLIHVPIGSRITHLGLRLPAFPWQAELLVLAGLFSSLAAADLFYRLFELRCHRASQRLAGNGTRCLVATSSGER